MWTGWRAVMWACPRVGNLTRFRRRNRGGRVRSVLSSHVVAFSDFQICGQDGVWAFIHGGLLLALSSGQVSIRAPWRLTNFTRYRARRPPAPCAMQGVARLRSSAIKKTPVIGHLREPPGEPWRFVGGCLVSSSLRYSRGRVG